MNDLESQDSEIDLRQYIDVILRRRWIVVAAGVMTVLSTILYVYTATPLYKAKTLLLIEKARETGTTFAEGASVENTQDDYYQTQYMLLKSDTLLESVYKTLDLGKFPEFADPQGIEKLMGAVTINPIRRSRLVHVEVESPRPELAAQIANVVSETFVKQNMENQLFISKDILQAVSIDANSAQARSLQDGLPAVVNNPLIQQLKAEYVKLQSDRAHLTTRYTEKHPERLAVESNMKSLSSQIRVETDKIVQALKTELSGQLKGNNVRIVDMAKVPPRPFKPRKLKAIAISIILGGIGGICLALLVEALDQSIRTQEDVEQKLETPFLGLVPFLQFPKSVAPYSALLAKEPSLTGEAFRNLRTMTDFAHVSDKDHTILVTSTVQEEGKTYVASNLAVAMTQLGGKVLIIDGDLRRPQVHKNFRISSKCGLSDFLASGTDVEELHNLVQKCDVPGLDVLPCGTRPPNPSELLNTPRMNALMKWARANYERIVVDCTPMFPIHDTLLWSRHIPTATFVVRYGRTSVRLIQSALQRLKGAGVKLAGVTVNAAQPGGLTYASYGYYYQQYYRSYTDEAAKTGIKSKTESSA